MSRLEMTDFAKARELGTLDGVTWASTRARNSILVTISDRDRMNIAKKQAMIRLITFLDQTFRDRPTEDVLREALGISSKDDLLQAQIQYEDAWADAVVAEAAKFPDPIS